MEGNRASVKMPELLVFFRAMGLGFLLSEIFVVAHIGGSGLAGRFAEIDPTARLVVVASVIAPFIWYALSRGVIGNLARLGRSRRLDLLLAALLGAWANHILSAFTTKFHEHIAKANPLWALLVTGFLLVLVVSPIVRALNARRKDGPYQMYFLTDEEIHDAADDVLANQGQAKEFALTVLASGSNTGLVYGIDGPWGIGKTSFLNLASNYWRQNAANEVIVFRFEPLRYASDPDLADKFIRDLATEIQRQVFVPEFRPAASRYSRMLKGKADFSFLGFKLSLAPDAETIDELLEDIDDVLTRIRRRVIVIVDDLDRLEAKAVNKVLFTVRRTFKLTQAAYILCYDTENLVETKEEGERARQFLEKFVNVKLSLFVDSSTLVRFLESDWKKDGAKYQAIPAETMLKLGTILSELAEILKGEAAAPYMPLIGDMRKLKRFVNALLLVQIDKTDLATTDFNSRDLINLMLLHLNYPGIFRRIYVEETEGRSGRFSIKIVGESGARQYGNDDGFAPFVKGSPDQGQFLLNQLFRGETLSLGDYGSIDESVRASRACFNSEHSRNLEKYLKLIVRFATPEPRETFKVYQDAVTRVAEGARIQTVLSEPNFDLKDGERAHDQFWRILLSQAYDFKSDSADDAIDTLVQYLPRYSSVDAEDRGLRSRSIYTLILFLDRAGWGRTRAKRRANSPENVVEIAHRIFGEGKHSGRAVVDQLASPERGVLGLYDLMLFRLQCSADRMGQAYNLQTALLVRDDMNAKTSGLVTDLAVAGMRSISQRVFALFKLRYIDTGCNLFDAVDSVPDDEFMGDVLTFFRAEAIRTGTEQRLKDLLLGTRSMTKGFVVYQLANRKVSSGVGCGYYDAEGARDGGNIAAQINDYLFDVCFDPDIDARNTEHFLDFCLANLTSGLWSGDDEEGYHPTIGGIANELDAVKLATYWARYGKGIRDQGLTGTRRTITTLNYTASYANDLPKVFEVLDKIQASEEEKVKAKVNAGPAENGSQTASVDKPIEDNASDAVAGE